MKMLIAAAFATAAQGASPFFITSTLSFGAQHVRVGSSPENITVANAGSTIVVIQSYSVGGTNASDFAIAQNTCPSPGGTLGSGDACTISMTFDPTAIGVRQATLSVSDNATGSPQVSVIYGVGALSDRLVFSTSVLDFGFSGVNTISGQSTVTVRNVGTENVSFSAVLVSGADAADFAIAGDTCDRGMAPGSSCAVTLTFTPAITGVRKASLTFNDSGYGSPQAVALTGIGEMDTRSLYLSALNYDFGSVVLEGMSNFTTFTAQNEGTANLTITSVSSSSEFPIGSQDCSGAVLVPGDSCFVDVAFAPSTAGVRAASLSFSDNAGGSPQSIELSGVGLAISSTFSVNPQAIVLPNTVVGTGNELTNNVRITNTGDVGEDYSFTSPNPDFSLPGSGLCGPPALTPPGSYCLVSTEFVPSMLGLETSKITISFSPDQQFLFVAGLVTPAPAYSR